MPLYYGGDFIQYMYIKLGGSSRFPETTLWAHPHVEHGQRQQ